jgi:uncharacterized protein (DUF427 family)
MRGRRQSPGPGQESVWDYPRPPRCEPSRRRVRVVFAGRVVADSLRAFRVLETSHPPVYYVPPADCDMTALVPVEGESYCEFKGMASYYDLRVDDQTSPRAAWYYPSPTAGFAALADHIAFYPGRVDRCMLDEETVMPQEGDFYGGWITADIVGPFKGLPGTSGW